jgi:MoaA/NifB/PqqE/SkfB family radical SAM enzyme
MTLSILYRGPLSSCNYACGYCPFAKRRESAAELELDRVALSRFVDWVEARTAPTSIFFTPWGEALVRSAYRHAIARLSRMEHVRRVAIQTNLSIRSSWTERCDREKLALWCTYHPGETTRAAFVGRCLELVTRGVRFSVGVVGLRDHLDELEALRAALPPEVYLWVNAHRAIEGGYRPEEIRRIVEIDPFFPSNLAPPPSLGAPCRAGETVMAVDGAGDVRRCHFVPETIGNIYAPDWERALVARTCPNATCRCHIGYVHRHDLALYDVYGAGVLERVPRRLPMAADPRS